MKRNTKLMLMCLWAFTICAMMTSCKGDDADKRHSIVVLHSWNDQGEEGLPFRETMDRMFRERGINAELHHIYFNAVHTGEKHIASGQWMQMEDSMEIWKPEVILINDDAILDWIIQHPEHDHIFNTTPSVFAGINLLQRDSLYRYTNMTGFEDKIDLPKNLNIYKRVTGRPNPAIEIDFTPYDMRMRKYLFAQIADTTRYINDYDFHMKRFNRDSLEAHHPGCIMVNFISAESPEANSNIFWQKRKKGEKMENDDIIAGKEILGLSYCEAETAWQIQVKYDIYSNSFVDRSRWTQFTCIREQFNDKENTRFLCGYFTSMETQVEDQVEYATAILRGTKTSALPIAEHKKGYYLDYNAMARYKGALTTPELMEMFEVVNLPLRLRYPIMAMTAYILAILAFILFLAFLVYRLYKWFNSSQLHTLELLKKENDTHTQLFIDTQSSTWSSDNGVITMPKEIAEMYHISSKTRVEDFEKMLHEDCLASWEILKNHTKNLGRKRLRLHVTLDKGNSWHWYEMIYNATEETAQTGKLSGLLVNIDDVVAKEDEMKRAYEEVSDTELKESFLANISHDLRTPLNAVTGFSNLLTMASKDTPISDKDKKEFSDIIHQNSEMMLTMIDNVVDNTIEGVADIKMKMMPRSVSTLINECYKTNAILAPHHLHFAMEYSEPDCEILIDVHRMKQVLNNFISNAFKFTAEGEVVIGWRYVNDERDDNEVPIPSSLIEIYVRDTGKGISDEDQKHLFDRFYKVTERDKGTGLGLNISKTIIEKHNGTIGVTSKLGEGSTFYIRLKFLNYDQSSNRPIE